MLNEQNEFEKLPYSFESLELLEHHASFSRALVAEQLEGANQCRSFPWKFMGLMDPNPENKQRVLTEAKQEWTVVRALRRTKYWAELIMFMPHLEWQSYHKLMICCEAYDWEMSDESLH